MLLQAERTYAPVLSGFEAIDQGRRVLEDGTLPDGVQVWADVVFSP